MNERVTREDLVEQSCTDWARMQLFDVRGYPQDEVDIVEEFDFSRKGGLDKNEIAIGFNFDDGGEAAELGSDLIRRVYTIEYFVFGRTLTWARNLGQALKFSLERDGTIPLKDITDPDQPEIDRLVVDSVSSRREPVPDPEPWQRYVWSVTLHVEDVYAAALA